MLRLLLASLRTLLGDISGVGRTPVSIPAHELQGPQRPVERPPEHQDAPSGPSEVERNEQDARRMVADALDLHRAGVVTPHDREFLKDVVERAGQSSSEISSADMTRLDSLIGASRARLQGLDAVRGLDQAPQTGPVNAPAAVASGAPTVQQHFETLTLVTQNVALDVGATRAGQPFSIAGMARALDNADRQIGTLERQALPALEGKRASLMDQMRARGAEIRTAMAGQPGEAIAAAQARDPGIREMDRQVGQINGQVRDLKGQIDTLTLARQQGAGTLVEQRQVQHHTTERFMEMGQLHDKLAAATTRLGALQGQLGQATSTSETGRLRKEIAGTKQELQGDLKSLIKAYQSHGGSQEAVAFLQAQHDRLADLSAKAPASKLDKQMDKAVDTSRLTLGERETLRLLGDAVGRTVGALRGSLDGVQARQATIVDEVVAGSKAATGGLGEAQKRMAGLEAKAKEAKTPAQAEQLFDQVRHERSQAVKSLGELLEQHRAKGVSPAAARFVEVQQERLKGNAGLVSPRELKELGKQLEADEGQGRLSRAELDALKGLGKQAEALQGTLAKVEPRAHDALSVTRATAAHARDQAFVAAQDRHRPPSSLPVIATAAQEMRNLHAADAGARLQAARTRLGTVAGQLADANPTQLTALHTEVAAVRDEVTAAVNDLAAQHHETGAANTLRRWADAGGGEDIRALADADIAAGGLTARDKNALREFAGDVLDTRSQVDSLVAAADKRAAQLAAQQPPELHHDHRDWKADVKAVHTLPQAVQLKEELAQAGEHDAAGMDALATNYRAQGASSGSVGWAELQGDRLRALAVREPEEALEALKPREQELRLRLDEEAAAGRITPEQRTALDKLGTEVGERLEHNIHTAESLKERRADIRKEVKAGLATGHDALAQLHDALAGQQGPVDATEVEARKAGLLVVVDHFQELYTTSGELAFATALGALKAEIEGVAGDPAAQLAAVGDKARLLADGLADQQGLEDRRAVEKAAARLANVDGKFLDRGAMTKIIEALTITVGSGVSADASAQLNVSVKGYFDAVIKAGVNLEIGRDPTSGMITITRGFTAGGGVAKFGLTALLYGGGSEQHRFKTAAEAADYVRYVMSETPVLRQLVQRPEVAGRGALDRTDPLVGYVPPKPIRATAAGINVSGKWELPRALKLSGEVSAERQWRRFPDGTRGTVDKFAAKVALETPIAGLEVEFAVSHTHTQGDPVAINNGRAREVELTVMAGGEHEQELLEHKFELLAEKLDITDHAEKKEFIESLNKAIGNKVGISGKAGVRLVLSFDQVSETNPQGQVEQHYRLKTINVGVTSKVSVQFGQNLVVASFKAEAALKSRHMLLAHGSKGKEGQEYLETLYMVNEDLYRRARATARLQDDTVINGSRWPIWRRNGAK